MVRVNASFCHTRSAPEFVILGPRPEDQGCEGFSQRRSLAPLWVLGSSPRMTNMKNEMRTT